MSGAAISATAAGVVALVVGLFLAWKKDMPRLRMALLIAGSTTVVGGVFGRIGSQAAATFSRVGEAATTALFGSAVGVVLLVLLTLMIVRGVLKGQMSRWTDAGALLLPPVAASFGGIVWAGCLLVSSLVGYAITSVWQLGALGAGVIRSQVGG